MLLRLRTDLYQCIAHPSSLLAVTMGELYTDIDLYVVLKAFWTTYESEIEKITDLIIIIQITKTNTTNNTTKGGIYKW